MLAFKAQHHGVVEAGDDYQPRQQHNQSPKQFPAHAKSVYCPSPFTSGSNMRHVETLESRRLLSTGSISGTVFNDLNADTLREAGEPGLSSFKVFVDFNKDGIHQQSEPSAVSGTNGAWKITGVAPGNYWVEEVRQIANWTETTGFYDPATVKAGSTTSGLLFGNAKNKTLVKFTFDGPKFYAPSIDTPGLGGSTSTLTQTGNDVVTGGQAGDSGKAAAWNRGVNDGNNALTLHTRFFLHSVTLSFDYRSTAISATGKSFGPASITITDQPDMVPLPQTHTIMLTRDGQWHHVNLTINSRNVTLLPKGMTITLTPSDGADLGTLSIDNLTISGILP